MGFWKDVAYDISRGMSKQDAIELNAILRSNASKEEKQRAEQKAEFNLKIDTML